MKKASRTGKTTGKKEVDLFTAGQANILSRMYQKTEGYPQDAGEAPHAPSNTDIQSRCSIHRNNLETSEHVRLEFQMKKETLKTKQKCI